jgi:GTP-binding protein Era
MTKKCGYVALMGRPNAGKSTLLNSFLKTKLAVVSNKPQTTRNKILGIDVVENTQILFLDTPGIHKSHNLVKLNKLMNKEAWAALKDADIILYLIDITSGFSEEDGLWLKEIFQKYRKELLVVLTKTDKMKKHEIEQSTKTIAEHIEFLVKEQSQDEVTQVPFVFQPSSQICALSAKAPEQVDSLKSVLVSKIPAGDWLYSGEEVTDRPQKFVCAEFIREQIFRQLGAELPYKIAVIVDGFEHKPRITRISATIYVERESHKSIVLGKGGHKIKEIGQEARVGLERHLERQVFLELFVKVK